MNTDNMEALKFLMDCAFREAALFWSRNNVFLIANLATFSAAFAYLTAEDVAIAWPVRLGLSLFGVALCVIWLLVIKAGRHMNHTWTDQAKKLAATLGSNEIQQALEGTPSDAVTKGSRTGATLLMYWLAAMFGVVWMCLYFVGTGGLILALQK